MWTKLTAFLSAGLLAASPASAYWDVQKSDQDVFGKINVTVSSVGDNGTLIRFECGSSSSPFFVFLIRDSSGEIPEIPATFVYMDKVGERHETDAKLVSWNDKFVAVKVTELSALREVAEHMKVAKKSISVGVSIPLLSVQMADTFSSRGSTKAGQAVLDDCLDE